MEYAYYLVSLLAIILPFVLGWILLKRLSGTWKPFLAGIATFIVSQLVHVPMLYLFSMILSRTGQTAEIIQKSIISIVLYALAMGLMAGLCEELTRYFVYRRWYREGTWKDAVMLGAGHGGIECVILVGFIVLLTLIRMLAIRDGDMSGLPATGNEGAALHEQAMLFFNVPWWRPFIALLERAFAIPIQIALSLMVMTGVRKRTALPVIAAISIHSAVDLFAVYALMMKWPIWALEGFVGICGVISVIYVLSMHEKNEKNEECSPSISFPSVDISREKETVIDAQELSKVFDGITAVENISFSVRKGEIFGFLGPNGAGKTTTVRMLCALVAPSDGRATIGGYRLGRDNDEIRRIMGILTETPGLYPRLSACMNLDFYARLYEVKNRDAQIKKYLSLLGLWERKDDRAGDYSKGMRQKLAIARALLHEPSIVFLDEPTGPLDPESAHVVRDFIRELKAEGRTIFLCTHNLDEADRLCDRIAIIKKHLVSVDTPESLRARLYGRKVQIRGTSFPEHCRELISALPFVKSVESEDKKLIVELEDPEKNNALLIRKLVECGSEIQYVEKITHSLEEVYFSLIEKDGGLS
ncbi:MAG: YhfC family glutamic-type intramembrane protease [Vulcanimicrobiota bacterium]